MLLAPIKTIRKPRIPRSQGPNPLKGGDRTFRKHHKGAGRGNTGPQEFIIKSNVITESLGSHSQTSEMEVGNIRIGGMGHLLDGFSHLAPISTISLRTMSNEVETIKTVIYNLTPFLTSDKKRIILENLGTIWALQVVYLDGARHEGAKEFTTNPDLTHTYLFCNSTLIDNNMSHSNSTLDN